MAASRAVISGLAPLLKDLREAGELEARKALMQALKDGGAVIRDEAARNVASEGLVKSGRLLKLLKVSATARKVSIVDKARNAKDGYRYPSRFEYGRSKGKSRAFLNPALDSKQLEALEVVADGISKALKKHDL